MIYFLVWLAVTISNAVDSIKFKYLIFLTQWGFIVWNSYLVLSAITTTIAVFQQQRRSTTYYSTKINDCALNTPKKLNTSFDGRIACCGSEFNFSILTIPFKMQWILFLIGGEYAVAITVLYWCFFYDPNSEQDLFTLDSLNLHMINGIFAIVDLWLSGIPVRIYHALYSISFGCVYVVFTIVYYSAHGTDPDGNQYIYPFLDYSNNPQAVAVLGFCSAVIFIGSIHFIFFLQYVVRRTITSLLCISESDSTS